MKKRWIKVTKPETKFDRLWLVGYYAASLVDASVYLLSFTLLISSLREKYLAASPDEWPS